MSGPADIPNFSRPSQPAPAEEPEDTGVRNDLVRAAIEAVAEQAGEGTGEPAGTVTTMHVLRHCLHGFLLLDVTGSEIEVDDQGQIAEGSTISIRGGEGPDGESAIFAFTSQEQLARMYPDGGAAEGVQVQSLVQEAAGVLELIREQEASWLLLDAGGPSVALSADDIDFALRVPRNDAVRAAVDPGVPREALLEALRQPGPLSLAVDAPELEPGEEQTESTPVRVRTLDAPDGNGQALAVFTSGPEVIALSPDDRIATQDASELVALAANGDFGGLLVNAAGPWAYVTVEELKGLSGA